MSSHERLDFKCCDRDAGHDAGVRAADTRQRRFGSAQGSTADLDDGRRARVVVMDTPEFGWYLPPMIWSMQFGHTNGAVLLVMASHPYDRSDYVSDYAEFTNLAHRNENKQS